MRRENVIKALLFGTVALFLCGAGDWLLGYVPLGGEPILFGFLNSNIVQVPSWFYLASMALGILSGFGCRAYRHRLGAIHISGRLRGIPGTCTDVPCLLESI